MGQLYLYSTNAIVVYDLCVNYYKGNFRVYGTKEFDSSLTNDASSDPQQIYHDFLKLIRDKDKAHRRYVDTEVKMSNLARAKYSAKEITLDQFDEIRQILSALEPSLEFFCPLVYVIFRNDIEMEYKHSNGGGNPSEEFFIPILDRQQFEILTIELLARRISNP